MPTRGQESRAAEVTTSYSTPLMCLVAVVTLEPCEGADTYVNGKKVTEPSILRSGMVGNTRALQGRRGKAFALILSGQSAPDKRQLC